MKQGRIPLFSAIILALLAGCMSQPPAPIAERPQPTSGAAASKQAAMPTTVVTPSVPAGAGMYTVKRGDTLYRIALDNGQDYRDLAAWNNLTNPDAIKEGQVLRVMPPDSATASRAVKLAPAVESRPLDPVRSEPVRSVSSGNAITEPKGGKEPYSDEAYARLNKGLPEVAATKPEAKAAVDSKPNDTAVTDDVAWGWPVGGKVTAGFSDANKGLDFAGKLGDPVLAAANGKVVYAGAGLRGYGELVIVKHSATYLSAYAHNKKLLVKEGQTVTKGQKIAEMGNSESETVKLHFEVRKQGKPVDPAQYLPKR